MTQDVPPFNGYLASDYLENLFQQYLENPNNVTKQWRAFFDDLPSSESSLSADAADTTLGATPGATVSLDHERKQMQVLRLINAYRLQGHLHAQVNPLGYVPLNNVSETELSLEDHGLTVQDLGTLFDVETFVGPKRLMLGDLYRALIDTYCGSIGTEFMHIPVVAEREWIQFRIESGRGMIALDSAVQQDILERLTIAEGLEQYLGAKFPGAKRFSLEGADALLVCLDQLIQRAGQKGMRDIVIGMAHRGRLNVLVNTLGKKPSDLFEEFEGKNGIDLASGDVKYHQGFSCDIKIESNESNDAQNKTQETIHVALAFNPSHLEIVTPVVLGSVLAKQQRSQDFNQNTVLPIAIHGDAAFSGQGVVMETLNMSKTRAYSVGGTIHIVVNNQVGFTTSNPEDARSTLYCTDVAKVILAPIFHVNADDPQAVYFVTQLALDYRMQFNKDVIIDLVCYRRHGHNEADEPRATQPLMYKIINMHPTVRKIYADKLITEQRMSEKDVNALIKKNRDNLDKGNLVAKNVIPDLELKYAVNWTPYLGVDLNATIKTGLDKKAFNKIAQDLVKIPEHFVLQSRVAKIMADRAKMAAGELNADWGFAEMMAYASLLTQGVGLRLTGQDVRRGTFFHRHAVLHDQNTGEVYNTLETFASKQPDSVQIYDSLLSEEAVLAFEYGYSTAAPEVLTIWEAQFGDFANGAQVVVDQFISSGEQKWGRLCGLVMLLPHGYEGQGPEHSSARLERYLQLCAEQNMQVCVPSTAAQVFHMLRRQILRQVRRPLIVMSPKSLLRHKDAACNINELIDGHFQLVIGECTKMDNAQVQKIILCSGKVYYDLLEQRNNNKIDNVPIIRIEQLYPFPEVELKSELKKYPNAKQVIWCQEEPKNQGAWYATQHHLAACLGTQNLEYVGRFASASPAVGHYQTHLLQQQALVNQALTL